MPDTRKHVFDELFGNDEDPWNFRTSDYERDKRVETLAILRDRRFASIIELGCANGTLTRELAAVCETVLGIDVSSVAIDLARRHCRDVENAGFAEMEVPAQWPDGAHDLLVFSEILYFLDAEEVKRVSKRAHASLMDSGLCLLVNWTGKNDLSVSGDDAVAIFTGAADWKAETARSFPTYRLDVLSKP